VVSYSNTTGGNFAPTLVIDNHGASAQQLAEQLTHGGFKADSADTCPGRSLRSMRKSSLPSPWKIWYPD
jgi:hypothetical protein